MQALACDCEYHGITLHIIPTDDYTLGMNSSEECHKEFGIRDLAVSPREGWTLTIPMVHINWPLDKLEKLKPLL